METPVTKNVVQTAQPVKKQIIPRVSMEKLNISIDYRKNFQYNTRQETQNQTTTERRNMFSAEELETAWFDYARQLEQEHVRQMMNDVELQCTENDALFDVYVESALQRDIIKEESDRTIIFLRDALQNDSVKFNIVVKSKDQKVKKVVTNADHFKEMLEQNENFRFLAQELGMELS